MTVALSQIPSPLLSSASRWTSAPPDSDATAALRQLRHLTNNTLQRILCEVARHDGLQRAPKGRRLCEDLERRILCSAAIADALFGLTHEPGPLPVRLRSLGEAVIGLLGDPDQLLSLEVSVEGRCPAALEEVVLRIAHELLGNAVKHGMRARLVGRLRVRLVACDDERGTRLTVADDGWGCGREPKRSGGQGLDLVRALIAPLGGTLNTLRGHDDGGFTAEVDLPPPATPASSSGRAPHASATDRLAWGVA